MPIDMLLFRQLAGSFATGVTVVTTGVEGTYHGMTVSAFASLSLEPTQVIVCVDRTAQTLPILQSCRCFNVNVLSADQEQLSRTFASKDAPERHGLVGVDYRIGALGVPLLNGALAYLECRVVHEFDGGDHIIVVGDVVAGDVGEAMEPLLYYRGGYRRLVMD